MSRPVLPKGNAMPGTLHIVSTPIGNLEDITLRALRVLREVSLIAAEDTRHTRKLLDHFGIQTRTVSYHEHNYRSRQPALLAELAAGRDVALVSDAGTPGVSDPGTDLVRTCLEHGIPVSPVPGPSALLAAAAVSGLPLVPFTFFGFAPARANDRTRWLDTVLRVPHTVCFFEAPHRIHQTLLEMRPLLGNRQIAVARELTKLHEELVTGSIDKVCELLADRQRGEFVVLIGPAEGVSAGAVDVSDEQIATEFGQMQNSGEFSSRRAAVTALARRYNRPPRDLYRLLLDPRTGDPRPGDPDGTQ